jgi:hypothetical protein
VKALPRKVTLAIMAIALATVLLGPCWKTEVVLPVQAQSYVQDGFESGTFDSWSGLTLTSSDNATVTRVNPYQGSFSAYFRANASPSGTRKSCAYLKLNGTTSVYVRGYFYIAEGLPLGENGDRFGLIALGVGSTILASFRIFRTGGMDKFNIIGYNGTGNYPSKNTDAVYPQEDQWYCIEFFAKIHNTTGEYRAWINGVERLSITGVNSAVLGSITTVWWGLAFSIDVQNPVGVYGDCAAIAETYVGTLKSTFGVVGSPSSDYAIRNFYWLFGNQSISYSSLAPSEITQFADADRFDGLVLWTKNAAYNATAIKQFAQTHIVIADMWDFCKGLYPILATSIRIVSTATVTYNMYWGNFRSGDRAEMRNETGNVDKLTTVLSSGLSTLSGIRTIAQFNSSHIAFFHMNGTRPNSGFYVMDLDATTSETEFAGIWHIFPVVKMVRDFPSGKLARWMADGQQWYDLTWVYDHIDTLVSQSNGIATKLIIGKSVEGRDIPAIVIGTGTSARAHFAIIDGAIHGDEKTGTFASLRLAELLLSYYQSSTLWRSRLTELTVIVIPVLNPDGFVRNTRDNAHGVDLNSQFPPDGVPTEPEAFALINLMGRYTPTVYINYHEGYYWYPLDLLYGNYESGAGKAATITAMQQANETFSDMKHWGRFTEQNSDVWIGGVEAIYGGGKLGMAIAYASYQYHASCMLMETFMWTHSSGARKNLWALDYYPAVSLSFLASHTQGDTTAKIANFDVLFANNPNAKIILPSYGLPTDWTASTFVSTTLTNVTEGYDTDPAFVDQSTGNAIGSSGTGIISFAGPIPNTLTKYAETANTPALDRAPTQFYSEEETFYFLFANGTKIPGASLNHSVINNDQDMFLIETYKDSSGRYIMLCYGFGWKGTYAAGKYFGTVIYPNISSSTESWIIVKWNDTNNDGFVGTPEDGDTYTVVGKGN